MRWLKASRHTKKKLISYLKAQRANPARCMPHSMRSLSTCTSLPGCHRLSCRMPHLSLGLSKRPAKLLTQARLSHQVCCHPVSVPGRVFEERPLAEKQFIRFSVHFNHQAWVTPQHGPGDLPAEQVAYRGRQLGLRALRSALQSNASRAQRLPGHGTLTAARAFSAAALPPLAICPSRLAACTACTPHTTGAATQ